MANAPLPPRRPSGLEASTQPDPRRLILLPGEVEQSEPRDYLTEQEMMALRMLSKNIDPRERKQFEEMENERLKQMIESGHTQRGLQGSNLRDSLARGTQTMGMPYSAERQEQMPPEQRYGQARPPMDTIENLARMDTKSLEALAKEFGLFR